MLAVFSPIFVADTKITSVYNFVAPLIVQKKIMKTDENLKKRFFNT